MKKVLSLFLALIMGLSVCAAVPAYASDYNYECYAIPHGKKGGEIVGYFIDRIKYAESVEGCEEVVALEQKAYEKCRATQIKLRDVLAAVSEVEKDKTEMEIICFELQEDWFCYAEGLGSSLGDPSAAARDIDICIADIFAAKEDAETALENGNWKMAYRALLEIQDAEETYYKGFISAIGGDINLLISCLENDADNVYERAEKLKKKAEADVKEANKQIDEATELLYSMFSYLAAAREKANELNHPEVADSINHDGELADDFCFLNWKHESFDFEGLDRAVEAGKARNLVGYFSETVKEFPDLLPTFFVTANDLTYNGQEQKLVTPGKILPEGEDETVYALGKKPSNMYPDFDWSVDVLNSEMPEESAFSTEIPSAKDIGTYYVYCKYPDGETFVKTVTIKPFVVKDNTLTAKGKTVKVKASTVKKKSVKIKRSKAITVKNAIGAVSYKKSKGNKKIVVAKNGNITVKKGLKKGTYKVKIKVTAAGNENYKSAAKTVTVKIVVK